MALVLTGLQHNLRHNFFRSQSLRRSYSTVSKWTCTENADGSLTLFNNTAKRRVNISHECAQYGCQRRCLQLPTIVKEIELTLLPWKFPLKERVIVCSEVNS